MDDTSLPGPWHTTGPAAPLRWKAIWPITGDGQRMTMRELVAEAKADLPAVAARHRYALLSRPRFVRAPGQDHPGSGGADEVLVAYCLVVPVQRPADGPWPDADPGAPRVSRADTYVDLADMGCTWQEVEQRTGYPRKSVRATLNRAGRQDVCARLDRVTDGPEYVVPSHPRAAA